LGVRFREGVPVDIDALSLPGGFTVLERPPRNHTAGDEEDVPQVRGDRGAAQGGIRPDPEAQLLRPHPTERPRQGHRPGVAAAVRRPELAAQGRAGKTRDDDEARVQRPTTGAVLRQQNGVRTNETK
jgi:hypothetical protein